jgi:hemoglobin
MLAEIKGRTVVPSDLSALKRLSAAMPTDPDAPDGLARLKRAGFTVITLSNDPVIGVEGQRMLREESEMADKTLYERLGGAYAIATAVDYLIDRLQTNATLNSRNQKVNEFHTEQYKAGYKFMVTAWCIEATGGPKCYPGRDMFESHKHLGLTDYEFDVTAHEIRNTLYQLGVPPQEIGEFMDIIESYRGKVLSRA